MQLAMQWLLLLTWFWVLIGWYIGIHTHQVHVHPYIYIYIYMLELIYCFSIGTHCHPTPICMHVYMHACMHVNLFFITIAYSNHLVSRLTINLILL